MEEVSSGKITKAFASTSALLDFKLNLFKYFFNKNKRVKFYIIHFILLLFALRFFLLFIRKTTKLLEVILTSNHFRKISFSELLHFWPFSPKWISDQFSPKWMLSSIWWSIIINGLNLSFAQVIPYLEANFLNPI